MAQPSGTVASLRIGADRENKRRFLVPKQGESGSENGAGPGVHPSFLNLLFLGRALKFKGHANAQNGHLDALGVLAGLVGADRALCGCNMWTALQPPAFSREPRRARALPGLPVAE